LLQKQFQPNPRSTCWDHQGDDVGSFCIMNEGFLQQHDAAFSTWYPHSKRIVFHAILCQCLVTFLHAQHQSDLLAEAAGPNRKATSMCWWSLLILFFLQERFEKFAMAAKKTRL
jgi:hypothetical protein